ncbi:hypothetical protein F5Y10DRAFT_103621 [Nemania abortiva]|nr:hypothetical protein F5Y10DRAFT_103621 [Nemania abortiva]
MFSSWKLDSNGQPSERPQVFDPVTAKTLVPQACVHCRAKKIKCTGEKDGCYRCKTLSRACKYTPGNKKGPGQRKTSSSSSDTSTAGAPVTTLPPPETLISQSQPQSPPKSPFSSAAQLVWENLEERDALRRPCTSAEPASMLDFLHSNLPNLFPSEYLHADTPTDILMNLSSAEISAPLCTPLPMDSQMNHMDFFTSTSSNTIASRSSDGDIMRDLDLETPLSSVSSSCRCLNRVMLLMDEVESLGDSGIETLDAALATHKDALRQGREMLECTHCVLRMENMMMLTFLAHMLARLCKHVALTSTPTSVLGVPPSVGLGTGEGGFLFGSYVINCREEYHELIKGLLNLHVRKLLEFLARLKQISQRLESDSMLRRLAVTESSIRVLVNP